jgi:hypothetical protein
MIAYGVKKNLNIPWHADFQDPWTQIDYFPQLMLNPISKMIHQKMEQRIFKNADKITICSDSWKTDLESIGAKNVDVIVWGYDEADFELIPNTLSNKFTLSHFGSLGPDRNPSTLWRVLSEISEYNPQFKQDLEIELVGFIGHAVADEIEKLGLISNLKKSEHIPRNEALVKMCASQALLLILNDMPNVNGRLPGKLFEYLASRRPVIVIGPESSDASKIVHGVNAGYTCNFKDYEKTKETVISLYDKFRNSGLPYNQTPITQYSNLNLTGKLASYLDKIIK